MTTRKLNHDILALKKAIEYRGSLAKIDPDSYFDFMDCTAKPEFKRLYYADKEFKYISRRSILILLRLNLRHRFEPLHVFGIFINL